MRATNRILGLVAAVAMLVAALAVPAWASAEGTLLSRINASRANAGLPPVEVYWDLVDDARAHTDAMIAAGHIHHNPSLSGVTGVWQALGENVGVGFDANGLHDAFMASSGHRSNILGDFNYVGIGAKTGPDGLVWATVVFMRADPGLNGGATTTTAAPTTTTTAAPVTTTTAPVSSPPTTYEVRPAGSPVAPAATGAVAPKAVTPKAVTPKAPAIPVVGFGRPDNLPAIPD